MTDFGTVQDTIAWNVILVIKVRNSKTISKVLISSRRVFLNVKV